METKPLELTEEQKQQIVKEVNTEVTSIAEEEKRTGEKIVVPDAERLVMLASQSLIRNRKQIHDMMLHMPKRQIIRAVTAFLDLPHDGVPVRLKEEAEKILFGLGQRVQTDRYILIYHHTMKLAMEDKLRKQEEEQAKKESSDAEQTTEVQ